MWPILSCTLLVGPLCPHPKCLAESQQQLQPEGARYLRGGNAWKGVCNAVSHLYSFITSVRSKSVSEIVPCVMVTCANTLVRARAAKPLRRGGITRLSVVRLALQLGCTLEPRNERQEGLYKEIRLPLKLSPRCET